MHKQVFFLWKRNFRNKLFQFRDNPDDDQSVFQKLLDSCASSLEVKLSLFLFWLSYKIFQDFFDACLMCDGSGKRVILDFAPFSSIDGRGCELSIIKQIFSKGANTTMNWRGVPSQKKLSFNLIVIVKESMTSLSIQSLSCWFCSSGPVFTFSSRWPHFELNPSILVVFCNCKSNQVKKGQLLPAGSSHARSTQLRPPPLWQHRLPHLDHQGQRPQRLLPRLLRLQQLPLFHTDCKTGRIGPEYQMLLCGQFHLLNSPRSCKKLLDQQSFCQNAMIKCFPMQAAMFDIAIHLHNTCTPVLGWLTIAFPSR